MHDGELVLRNEDLDRSRCKMEYVNAMLQDLRWLGLDWHEGPDCGGAYGPYDQSLRQVQYVRAFERLKEGGYVYPCICSRQDVVRAASAPHPADDGEAIYPGICDQRSIPIDSDLSVVRINWRFRVPHGQAVTFVDGSYGPQEYIAGRDFGDFVVWRHDGIPSYQLAVVVDDAAMQITEVVRGADLLVSTARQILLYRALGLPVPDFFHCELVTDQSGIRLAKRSDALSIRTMRESGRTPDQLLRELAQQN